MLQIKIQIASKEFLSTVDRLIITIHQNMVVNLYKSEPSILKYY